MTDIDLRKIQAGPVLDTACAKALGIQWCWFPNWKWGAEGYHVYSLQSRQDWSPSTSIGDAWDLIESLGPDCAFKMTTSFGRDNYVAEIGVYPHKSYSCSAKTAPLAICRVFLLFKKDLTS